MTGMAKAPDRWHRPLVESGAGRERQALACVAAAK